MNTLRAKIPELILEAAMVVFAVVVALGVDEWRENRENAELADRALAGIRAEIQDNREELAGSAAANRTVRDLVLEAARDTVLPDTFSVNFEYGLISSSAWETAQVTRATQFIPLHQVHPLAKLYGVQELLQASQDQVMELILNMGDLTETAPERIPRLLRGPLVNAVGMGDLLVQSYDTTLVWIADVGG